MYTMTDVYIILGLFLACVLFVYFTERKKPASIHIDLGDIDSSSERNPTLTFNPPPAIGTNITVSYNYHILSKKKVKKSLDK
jgi:hypothetical protein